MEQPTLPPTKRPPQTVKEKRFATEYIKNGGNATEAAVQAYEVKSRDVARSLGAQNLARLSIFDELENAGLTDKKLAETIYNGVSAFTRGRDGEYTEDWKARAKFVEIALKLKGHLSDKPDDPKTLNFYQFLLSQQHAYEVPGVHQRQLTDHRQGGDANAVPTQPDSGEVLESRRGTDGEDAGDHSQSPSAGIQQPDSRDVHDGLSLDPEQSVDRGS